MRVGEIRLARERGGCWQPIWLQAAERHSNFARFAWAAAVSG